MRFNTAEFLFAFLPFTWLGWRLLLAWLGPRAAATWLVAASLGFYAWWDWRFAPLLVGSLLLNFQLGRRLLDPANASRRLTLVVGLVWNLGLLGTFKYADFFIQNLNTMTDSALPLLRVVLPLGISFYTFQKIAFLVDAWRGRVTSVRLLDFSLFVLFFPQLIAGPIVHHSDFIPQLRPPGAWRFDFRRFAVGATVFAAGLFQKAFVADGLAPMADAAFGLAAVGTELRWLEAWVGLSAYTLQLFFDFAGYSHMALGLGLMFGLRLPVNFLAPYTAASVIEFWRRWHITLSAFLRDYVYIPLGGNRHGFARMLAALGITMFLAGLWHGAGWTFVLWGVWHAVALWINHGWRRARGATGSAGSSGAVRSPGWARALTLLVVMLGWVLFRAPDLPTARLMAESLVGWHGFSVPLSWGGWVEALAPVVRPRGLFPHLPVSPTALITLALAAWLALRGPRLLAWCGVRGEDVVAAAAWQRAELAPAHAVLPWSRAVVAGVMLGAAVASLSRSSPFLYFQF
jgi:alginate O-acetyltransferase complex protein AlgI